MTPQILGLHHITAITRNARRNQDFYARILGLRLVKRTVNFNDPSVEHLFYGDWSATPGTLVTFFAWPEGETGRPGAGAVSELALTIPRASLAFWIERLIRSGVRYSGPLRRFEESALSFQDDDGLRLALVAAPEADEQPGWDGGPVPAEHTIRGIHDVTLWAETLAPTHRLLTETLGFRALAEQDGTTRYAVAGGGPGALVQVREVAGFWQAAPGVGTVHHVALRSPDVADLQGWHDRLSDVGLAATALIDRRYFQSIYAREPGGVILEIATDGPGFAVAESDGPIDQPGVPAPDVEFEWDALAGALPAASADGTGAADMTGALDFVHRFEPAAAEGAPTLLLLHGTGGNEEDLIELGRALAPQAALLSPRGKILENGMPRFFRRLAEGVFDLDDLRRRTNELAAFVEAASATYGFDPRRVIAVGYSNGANIGASLLLLSPETLAGAVLFHGMVPLVPEALPNLHDVPVFIGAGRTDPLIPAAGSEQLADLLRQAGAEVRLHWEPGGHAISRAEVEAATSWLREHSAGQ